MTKQEAQNHLGLKESFTYNILDNAFKTKRTELLKKKTEAPNDIIKQAYTKALQEVSEAFQVLIPFATEIGYTTSRQSDSNLQNVNHGYGSMTSDKMSVEPSSLFGYYLLVLKKYVVFRGRSRRKEYWSFVLFNILFAILAIVLDVSLDTPREIGFGLFYMIYALGTFIPGLAAVVRRLHDIGKSGWMVLVLLIPFIGSIWILVLMVTEGNKGHNKYGADPKSR